MKRLTALTAFALAQVGCLDLEHRVHAHTDGRIDYLLRLGMDAKYANGPLAKPRDERDRDWQAHVPPGSAAYVVAKVEETPERTWLTLDAHLPDLAAYAAFRDDFVAQYELTHKKNDVFYPPVVDVIADSLVVRADLQPSTEPFQVPDDARVAEATWTLIVTGDAPVAASEGGVLSEDRHTATFQYTLVDAFKNGAYADVTVTGTAVPSTRPPPRDTAPPPGSGVLPWVLAAVLLLGGGAGVALALRKPA